MKEDQRHIESLGSYGMNPGRAGGEEIDLRFGEWLREVECKLGRIYSLDNVSQQRISIRSLPLESPLLCPGMEF